MEKIKIGLFDLFAYAIPGSIVIAIAYIFCNASNGDLNISLPKIFSDSIKFVPAVMLIIGSYIIGFFTNILGTYTLKYIIMKAIYRMYPKKYKYLAACGYEDYSYKSCIVRELSPENFRYIEQINVLKKMTSNLGLITFIGSLLISIKINNFCYFGIGIIISIIFFADSIKSYHRTLIDLDNTIKIFKLEENACKFLNQK